MSDLSIEQRNKVRKWTPWILRQLRSGNTHISMPYGFFERHQTKKLQLESKASPVRGDDGDSPWFREVFEAIQEALKRKYPDLTVYPPLGECDIKNEPKLPGAFNYQDTLAGRQAYSTGKLHWQIVLFFIAITSCLAVSLILLLMGVSP